ncbi:MAG TPA: dienelactone hydrolase family protein [Acidimicrobiales bacterium]|nr:dienelactone hydrolase family protein [Acidimicrobiales bacterium]
MHIQDVPYTVGGMELTGFLAVDDDRPGPRPSVLLCHEGGGLADNVRGKAIRLAGLGYLAFCLDYLGNLPREEAMAALGPLIGDRPRIQELAVAGLEQMLAQEGADPSRAAAIGFCFGGTMAIELGRTGADLKAIVGFHSGLPQPAPEDTRNIRAHLLLCLGAADPIIPPESRTAFEAELAAAEVADWRIELYGGVKHSFTNPHAASFGMDALAYDAVADRRSWRSMIGLFDEVFGPVD